MARHRVTGVVAAALLFSAGPLRAQAPGCCAQLDMLLEKTLAKVDVLTLEYVADDATAHRVEQLIVDAVAAARADGREPDKKALKEAVATSYMDGTSATATLTFLRDIGGDRFLDGQRESIERLAKSDLLSELEAEELIDDRLAQFSILKDRGLEDGDRLVLVMSGDTVTARYLTIAGEELVNSTRVGPDRRRAFLASYFGPDNDFRDKLVKSALTGAGVIED